MTGKDLLDGIGWIDESLINEAETLQPQKHPVKWIGLAACLAVLTVSAAILPFWGHHPEITMKENGGGHNVTPPALSSDSVVENGVQGEGAASTAPEADDANNNETTSNPTAEQPNSPVNELETAPNAGVTNGIALMTEDFVSMSYEEVLKYFSVTLPVSEVLPAFHPAVPADDQGYGVFKRSDGTAYSDINSFLFTNADKTQNIGITLAKVNRHVCDIQPDYLKSENIVFTKINGRDYAVFHYRDEQGRDCYHIQFRKDGIDYYIGSTNTTQEDFLKLAAALAPEKGSAPENGIYTLKGSVEWIDSTAGWIVFKPSDERDTSLTIQLTTDKEKANQYQSGEEITVCFRGEPITIDYLWEQQIIKIQKTAE